MKELLDWDHCANRHLLAYIIKQTARDNARYLAPEDVGRGATSSPAPLSKKLALILRAHAHCWALDMADLGNPPLAVQRKAFDRAMAEAELEVKKARETPINELSELL